jgi:hypothetical protein
MSRATLFLNSEADRKKAAAWARQAPPGTRVDFVENKRSVPQNDRMWALLTAVADQLEWHGQKYDTAAWKDYFMHAYRGEKWMPAEDGGMVPIGRSTSKLTKEEHSELTALIEAFCARQGVDIREEEAA